MHTDDIATVDPVAQLEREWRSPSFMRRVEARLHSWGDEEPLLASSGTPQEVVPLVVEL